MQETAKWPGGDFEIPTVPWDFAPAGVRGNKMVGASLQRKRRAAAGVGGRSADGPLRDGESLGCV